MILNEIESFHIYMTGFIEFCGSWGKWVFDWIVAVHLGVKMADTLSFTAKVDMVDFWVLVLELVGILWPWKGHKVSHFFHKLHVYR